MRWSLRAAAATSAGRQRRRRAQQRPSAGRSARPERGPGDGRRESAQRAGHGQARRDPGADRATEADSPKLGLLAPPEGSRLAPGAAVPALACEPPATEPLPADHPARSPVACGASSASWMVVCNMRVNPLAWPLAIAASLLYCLLFAAASSYGEAGLQVFFAVIAAWGWWQWLRGTQDSGGPLACAPSGTAGADSAGCAELAAWPLLGAAAATTATDSDVPGRRLSHRRQHHRPVAARPQVRRELADLARWSTSSASRLFAFKGLWLTVVLYALFAVMALVGWRTWAQACAISP